MNQINCVSLFFGRIESLSMVYNKFVSPFYVRKMYILCLVNWSFLNKEICNSCIWCTCNVNKNLCKNEESGLDLLSDLDVFLEIAEDVFPLKPYFEIKTEKEMCWQLWDFFVLIEIETKLITFVDKPIDSINLWQFALAIVFALLSEL